ncbi:MAG: nucleotide exchange factor GrpE [Proteobacteria bacterium]|nr:nucleotide exchange factor GrpE [Pseudomonadota bacterium]
MYHANEGYKVPVRRLSNQMSGGQGVSRGPFSEVPERSRGRSPGPRQSAQASGDAGFHVPDRRPWTASSAAEDPAGAERQSREPAQTRDHAAAKMAGEIARLTQLVDEKDRQARESAVMARRAEEELERAKSRIRKDAAKELEQKNRAVLFSFLEVLDDLERALDAARDGDGSSAVLQGIELVRKGFLAKLDQFGVTHLPALGSEFDPNRHEAVSMVPVSDAGDDRAVIGVVREGYLIGDETLRPAAVAVGKLSSFTATEPG